MIHYQMAHPVSDTLLGIKFINEHLRRMLIENQFCQCFEHPQIGELLQVACPDYKGLLINLFEPVFTNALGLMLLQRDVVQLDIEDEERNALKLLLQNTPDINQLPAQELCRAFNIQGKEQQAYLLQSAGPSLCAFRRLWRQIAI